MAFGELPLVLLLATSLVPQSSVFSVVMMVALSAEKEAPTVAWNRVRRGRGRGRIRLVLVGYRGKNF
jgi:hypothetical protein